MPDPSRTMPDNPDDATDLVKELHALRTELARLNRHRFIRIQNSTWRMMSQSFLRGLSMGLGTVVGATVLVSLIVYFLSQIDFIPIVGEWAKQIAAEIQAGQ
ncbi:MAG: DUF5665 domain-containing protein [Paracoccaceae bacterium]